MHLLIVAIDFGTSRSGFGWALRSRPKEIHCEPINDQLGAKQPTVLLLRRDTLQFVEFGHNAKLMYEEATSEEKEQWYYFSKFKTVLWGADENARTCVVEPQDVSGVRIEAKVVFVECLKYLKRMVGDRIRDLNMQEHQISWVLTVPAIWTEAGKSFMREVAVEAGFPSANLRLALESEAGALCVRTHLKNEYETKTLVNARSGFAKGFADQSSRTNGSTSVRSDGEKELQPSLIRNPNHVLVVDLGGGTADFTTHDMDLKTNTSRQISQSEGILSGGADIDVAFVDRILKRLFGNAAWDGMLRVYKKGLLEVMGSFDAFKSRIRSKSDGVFRLKLPHEWMEYLKTEHPQLLKSVNPNPRATETNMCWFEDIEDWERKQALEKQQKREQQEKAREQKEKEEKEKEKEEQQKPSDRAKLSFLEQMTLVAPPTTGSSMPHVFDQKTIEDAKAMHIFDDAEMDLSSPPPILCDGEVRFVNPHQANLSCLVQDHFVLPEKEKTNESEQVKAKVQDEKERPITTSGRTAGTNEKEKLIENNETGETTALSSGPMPCGITFSLNSIKIPVRLLEELYGPVMEKILEMTVRLLRQNESVGAVYLVGGFVLHPVVRDLLTQATQTHFGLTPLVPPHPSEAIIKGAVEYGLRPEQITGRRLRYSIGLRLGLPKSYFSHAEWETLAQKQSVIHTQLTATSPRRRTEFVSDMFYPLYLSGDLVKAEGYNVMVNLADGPEGNSLTIFKSTQRTSHPLTKENHALGTFVIPSSFFASRREPTWSERNLKRATAGTTTNEKKEESTTLMPSLGLDVTSVASTPHLKKVSVKLDLRDTEIIAVVTDPTNGKQQRFVLQCLFQKEAASKQVL